jgi:hypothetical protein
VADYNHNLPVEAYRAALLAELEIGTVTKEHKAAIVEELEKLPRTAVENRSGMESTDARNTVGRAPASTSPHTAGVEPNEDVEL